MLVLENVAFWQAKIKLFVCAEMSWMAQGKALPDDLTA